MNKQSQNKNTPLLIIGLGSIGQRHYKNLVALGYKNIWVYDLDKKRVLNIESRIPNLKQKLLKDFDVVFVCSPNNLHVKHALQAAKSGCHLFIEKPLSHNIKGVTDLQKIIKRKKLVNMVACNMRFHPALKFVKNYLDQKKLGKVYSISLEFGFDLRKWNKDRDYRKTYSASRKMGGGIILDDIHEFDLLFWLNNFAPIAKSSILSSKVSGLKIDVEDLAAGTFIFANKVVGFVKADYLQQNYTRRFQIVGERGTLEWDWNENIVWRRDENGKRMLLKIHKYDRNQMYLQEIKYFFNCVQKRKAPFNDIKIATQVLRAII